MVYLVGEDVDHGLRLLDELLGRMFLYMLIQGHLLSDLFEGLQLAKNKRTYRFFGVQGPVDRVSISILLMKRMCMRIMGEQDTTMVGLGYAFGLPLWSWSDPSLDFLQERKMLNIYAIYNLLT
jgi:hypothetical protein